MSEPIKGLPITEIGKSFFINQSLGSFFRGVLDWMGNDFYPRFEHKVIGTYNKSVEYFNQQLKNGNELDATVTPSVTLDPQLDFSQEERGGKFLWQNQYFDNDTAFKLNPALDMADQDMRLVPVYSRYQGTFELLFWLSSVMELIDFRTHLLQFTGGFGRYIRPKHFWSYIILPDSIKDYRSDVDDVPIDWSRTDVSMIQVNNINQKKWALPCVLNPYFKLDSFNDNSTKYGGDSLAEYKLSASFTYEIAIPTYMILKSKIGGKIQLNFHMGKINSAYGYHKSSTLFDSLKSVNRDVMKKDYIFYRIKKDQIENSTQIFSSSPDSMNYPEDKTIFNWNHIKSGKLKRVSSLSSPAEVEKTDILYFDTYNNNEHISYLRSCSAAIGNISKSLYSKCVLLETPVLLSNDMQDVLISVNQDITIDSLRGVIYEGLLETETIPWEDEEYAYLVLKYYKSEKPEEIIKAKNKLLYQDSIPQLINGVDTSLLAKKLVSSDCDGVQTTFDLDQPILNPNLMRIHIDGKLQEYETDYIFNNQQIIFTQPPPINTKIYISASSMDVQDVDLVAMYEFSDQDILENSSEIIINFDISDDKYANDYTLVSYNGQMVYERDYEIDKPNKLLKIKLKPMKDEIVQIFQLIRGNSLS